jgi:hypothetical protein
MTPTIPIAIALSCAACWTGSSQRLLGGEARVLRGRDSGTGAASQLVIGYAGVAIGSEIDVRDVHRADDTRTAAGIDGIVRVSIPGVLPSDHEIDHDIDFGFEAGGGGGGTHHGGFGEAFGGGWAEVRVSRIHDDAYTALMFGARKEWLTSWDDQLVYSFGIARRVRSAFHK